MILLDIEDEHHHWDVAIWHNCTAGREWTALNLSAHSSPHKMVEYKFKGMMLVGDFIKLSLRL